MPRGLGTRTSVPLSIPVFESRFNNQDGERRSHLLVPEPPAEPLTEPLRDTTIPPQHEQSLNG